jgi:hypothetical protein
MIGNFSNIAFFENRLKTASQWVWIAAIVVGMVLFSTGAVRFYWMVSSRFWPAVTGVIETSQLERGMVREGGLKYRFRLAYRYTVDDAQYEGERISFAGPLQGGGDARVFLDAYPKGMQVKVHHHPTNHRLSVLDVAWSWPAAMTRPFLGVGMTFFSFLGWWRRWPLQTDYLFRERDADDPTTWKQKMLGLLGMATCLGICWIWWELIKQYAGR